MLLRFGEHGLFIEVVEPPRHFPREFQMRQLVFSHRDEIRFVQENIGGLEDGIAEKAVGAEVLFFDLFLFFFVGRIPFQPGDGNHHRKEQVQDGMFRDAGLNEHSRASGIDACGQPVNEEFTHEFPDSTGVGIVRGKRVPVRHEEVTLILILQRFPVLQGTKIISEMHEAAGLHAAQHALFRLGGHGDVPALNPTAVERIVPERLDANVLVNVWMIRSSRSNTRSPTSIIMP